MSGSHTSSPASAASSHKRASSPPAAAQSAAPQPQPPFHSAIGRPPPKKARKNLLPDDAFHGEARARAPADPAAPVALASPTGELSPALRCLAGKPQPSLEARRQQLLTSVSAPATLRWSDLSPAQRCFTDGLALAFSCLSFAELVRAAAVCKAWLAATQKTNIAPVTLDNPSIGLASELLRWRPVSSPFLRHVHAITHNAAAHTLRAKKQRMWTIRRLAELGKLSQLRRISRLQISTACTDGPKSPVAFNFPPLLESADLHFIRDTQSGSASNVGHGSSGSARLRCVMRALLPCHSLTELSITLHDSSELLLDSLLEAASLQTLTIDIRWSSEVSAGSDRFTQAHIGVIKQLPSLRRLTLLNCSHAWQVGNPHTTGWLRWLCSLPHRLQRLEELDLSRFCLRLEHMQLLKQLPALTALAPQSLGTDALSLLPAFAERLQRLTLRVEIFGDDIEDEPDLFDEDMGTVHASFFLPHLTPCSRLTHLGLVDCAFSEAEARTLCQALPLLETLDLSDVDWPSFVSLRHLPRLESFSLQQSFLRVPRSLLIDIADMKPLSRLHRLTLICALERPLDSGSSALISALHPPSAVLPALAEFRYSPWPEAEVEF